MLLCELKDKKLIKEPLSSNYLDAPLVKNGALITSDKAFCKRYHLLDDNGSLRYVSKLSLDQTKYDTYGNVRDANEMLINQIKAMIELINQCKLTNVDNWWYMPELKILISLAHRNDITIKQNYNLRKIKVRRYNHQIVNCDRLKFEVFLSSAKTILVAGLPGTGKSSVIEGRIDTLVSNGEKASNILTFNQHNRHQIKQIFNNFKGKLNHIMVDDIEMFSNSDLLYIIDKANSTHASLLLTVNPLYDIYDLLKASDHLTVFDFTIAYRFNHYILDYAMSIITLVKPNVMLQKKYYSAYGLNKMYKLIRFIKTANSVHSFVSNNRHVLLDYIANHSNVILVTQSRKQLTDFFNFFKNETNYSVSYDLNSNADIKLALVWQAAGLNADNVIAYLSQQDLYQYVIALTLARHSELIIDATDRDDSILAENYQKLIDYIMLERDLKDEFGQTDQ